MEHWIYAGALAVISITSLTAILAAMSSVDFYDNLPQRVGLCLICFGSSLRLYTLLDGDEILHLRYMLTFGIAIYAAGTALAFWTKRQR